MLRVALILLMMTRAGATHAECVGDQKTIRFRDGGEYSVVVRMVDYGDGNRFNRGADISVFTDASCTMSIYHEALEISQGTHAEVLDTSWFHGIDIVTTQNGGGTGQFDEHQLLRKVGRKLIESKESDEKYAPDAVAAKFLGLPHNPR